MLIHGMLYKKFICWLTVWWEYCVGESPKRLWWPSHMMFLTMDQFCKAIISFHQWNSVPKDGSITPIWDAKESKKSIKSHHHQGRFGQLKMLQCFKLKVVPFKNGLVFWLINHVLLILVEMNQRVAQNPLIYVSMVLLAHTFRSSGWTSRPT